jgi:hypothetical protein
MTSLLPFLLLATLPAMAFTPLSPRSGPPFMYQADAEAYWRTHGPPLPISAVNHEVPAPHVYVQVYTAEVTNWFFDSKLAIQRTIDLHTWTTVASCIVTTAPASLRYTDTVWRSFCFYRAVNLP